MNNDDTYRMEELLPEAAMTPATEEVSDAPPPAAQTLTASEELSSRVPARTSAASRRLESLRNRMHGLNLQGANWMDAGTTPIDRSAAAPQKPSGRQAAPAMAPAAPQHRTMANGAALSTLMRSAVRQHTPAPTLSSMASAQHPSQAQMRGALRQVVRSAQQMPTNR